MKKVIVSDVCGTLFQDDTTIAFVQFYLKNSNQNLKYLWLNLLINKYSPFSFGIKVLEYITKKHFFKLYLFQMFKGKSVNEVGEYAKEFSRYLLKKRKIREVWDVLNENKSHKLILASASIEPVIKAIANELSVNFVCSELEIRNDKYTGKCTLDITGNKVQSLKNKFGGDFFNNELIGISDNFTDESLLKRCSLRFVVIHKISHFNKWNSFESNYIKVYK